MSLGSLSLTVTISEGDRSRTLPALALAAALRHSPREVCDVLRFLLDPDSDEPLEPQPIPADPQGGEGGRGMGKRSEGPVGSVTLEEINISQRSTFGTLGGGLGEGHAEHLAGTLAQSLEDPGSLAGFKRLAQTHPDPLLLEALRRTLQIPTSRITRSRGACFTGIVRKLAEAGWCAPPETHT